MDVKTLSESVCRGDIPALAKAITLLESKRSDQRDDALTLLSTLMPNSGKSIRLGMSGAPGVGKSTLIEALGLTLITMGYKVAVLAIDPSSPLSGGSILGDRIRMEKLANHPKAFIRPSPSQGTLGGTARHTMEAIIACEAAGFNFIIIETVGIGQSEVLAASMVDLFLYLHLPGSGDDIQGIKRGILELADMVAITKADGESLAAAHLAKAQLEQSLHLSKPDETPAVYLTSAQLKSGVTELATAVVEATNKRKQNGSFASKRQEQLGICLRNEIAFLFADLLSTKNPITHKLGQLEAQVKAGKVAPMLAAKEFVAELLK